MIHLVTGRQGQAHIKTSDVRSQNRAIYGDDLKRLIDRGAVSGVSVSGSKIIVSAGSYMWYGNHIKIDEDYEITVSFTQGGQDWRVYFEYTKVASGNDYVESVTIGADNSTVVPEGFTDDSNTTAQVNICNFITVNGIISGDITYNGDVVPNIPSVTEDIDELAGDIIPLKKYVNNVNQPYKILYDDYNNGFGYNNAIYNTQIPFERYGRIIIRLNNGCVGELYMATSDDLYSQSAWPYMRPIPHCNPFYFHIMANDEYLAVLCFGAYYPGEENEKVRFTAVPLIDKKANTENRRLIVGKMTEYTVNLDGTISVLPWTEGSALRIVTVIGCDPITNYSPKEWQE